MIELVLPEGSVEYGAVDDAGVLTVVIRITELDGGFAVTEWESSGC